MAVSLRPRPAASVAVSACEQSLSSMSLHHSACSPICFLETYWELYSNLSPRTLQM